MKPSLLAKWPISAILFASISIPLLLPYDSEAVPPGFVPPELLQMHHAENLPPESGDIASGQQIVPLAAEGAAGFAVCELMTLQVGAFFGGSDVWGWQAPDGSEYAIMGIDNGIVFVDATTGQIVDTVLGPNIGCGYYWRDMVTYGNYCYAVSECSGFREGMIIMDMSFLPDSVHFITAYNPGPNTRTSHNMAIDTAQGFAYVVSSSYNAVRVLDLSVRESPVDIQSVPVPSIHDMFARNDTLWVAEANAGSFSIWDMADKNAPNLLVRVSIPAGGYVHNIWPTGDGRHIATTEETAGKTVKIWNVEDLQNVTLVGQYLGASDIAHNAQFVGDTLYLSHYESGILVVDLSDPSNPTEIAGFDTWPSGNTSQFNGAWGVFPHTTSGKVYASNLSGQLFILQAQEFATDDTLKADTVKVAPASLARVDISVDNSFPVTSFTIPINWAGPYGLLFDSVSTSGIRTEYFQITLVGSDIPNSRGVWRFSVPVGQPSLPPGGGPVASIHFRVPATASGDSNPIKIDLVGFTVPSITTDCFGFDAPSVNGEMVLYSASGCCVGITGNVDNDPSLNVDIADLTLLIDHLFINFVPLVCDDAANIDGDLAGTVDIADLTKLIDHLFINFTPTSNCL